MQENGESKVHRNFIICTPYKVFLGRPKPKKKDERMLQHARNIINMYKMLRETTFNNDFA